MPNFMGLSIQFKLKLLLVYPLHLLFKLITDYENFNFKTQTIKWARSNASLQDARTLINDRSLEELLNDEKQKFSEISNEEFTSNSRWIFKADDLNKDSPIILFIHGGGFNLRTLEGHILGLVKTFRALKNPKISILGLDYQTTPESKFPTQIEQLLYVYHKLTDQDGFKNVLLLGDSAGGNIELILLYQLKNQLPNLLKIQTKPKGAAFLSPWVDLRIEKKGSVITNEPYDYLSYERLKILSDSYTDDVTANPLTSPASLTDWEGTLPEHVFYNYGAHEILADSIVDFAQKVGIDDKDTYIEPDGVHVHPYYEYAILPQEEFEQTPFCKNFINLLKAMDWD